MIQAPDGRRRGRRRRSPARCSPSSWATPSSATASPRATSKQTRPARRVVDRETLGRVVSALDPAGSGRRATPLGDLADWLRDASYDVTASGDLETVRHRAHPQLAAELRPVTCTPRCPGARAHGIDLRRRRAGGRRGRRAHRPGRAPPTRRTACRCWSWPSRGRRPRAGSPRTSTATRRPRCG